MLGQAADPVPFVGLRTGIQLARPLVSQSARLPGLPGVLQASEPPAQRASTSPDASCALVAGASSSQVVRLTPHRGGKRPVPQFGQVPYSRLSVISCPPAPMPLALSLSSCLQRGATHWTGWPLLRTCSAPGSALTLLGRILDQLGFQSAHSLVDLFLNFSKGRL